MWLESNDLVPPLVKSAAEFMGGINTLQDFYFLTLDFTPLCVIYLLILHSLATRWYCEQIMPPEINPFMNHLAEKLKASRGFICPSLLIGHKQFSNKQYTQQHNIFNSTSTHLR